MNVFGVIVAAGTTTTVPTVNVQSRNPILPAGNELVWGIFSFVVLFVVMAKLAFPAVQKAMEARTERIRTSLDDAERVKGEAETILDDYQRQLADARSEANRIIEEARQAAEQVRRDLIARAETDAQELRQRTQEDLEAAHRRALDNLRAQVAQIAIVAAEKIIERNLDRDAQMSLIENYINQVGSSQ